MPEFDEFADLKVLRNDMGDDFTTLARKYREAAAKEKTGKLDKDFLNTELKAMWYQGGIPEEVKSVKIGLLDARVTLSKGKSVNMDAKLLASILIGETKLYYPLDEDEQEAVDAGAEVERREMEFEPLSAELVAAIIVGATNITEYDYIQVQPLTKPKKEGN